MTKYAPMKPRFDRTLAKEGIWIEIVDEVGNDYGSFKVGMMNPANLRIKNIIERAERAEKMLSAKDEDKVIRHNLRWKLDCVLLDWDVRDANGKNIKFSLDEAIEFFSAYYTDEATGEKVYPHSYALNEIDKLSQNHQAFRSEEQVAAGDPVGNSSAT